MSTTGRQGFFYAKKNREAIFFGVDRATVRRRPPFAIKGFFTPKKIAKRFFLASTVRPFGAVVVVVVRPSWQAQQTPSWLAQQAPSRLAHQMPNSLSVGHKIAAGYFCLGGS